MVTRDGSLRWLQSTVSFCALVLEAVGPSCPPHLDSPVPFSPSLFLFFFESWETRQARIWIYSYLTLISEIIQNLCFYSGEGLGKQRESRGREKFTRNTPVQSLHGPAGLCDQLPSRPSKQDVGTAGSQSWAGYDSQLSLLFFLNLINGKEGSGFRHVSKDRSQPHGSSLWPNTCKLCSERSDLARWV